MSAGIGGKLWPAASAICRWMRDEQLAGQHVLELGCGCGVAGLYAAGLGAESVLLTDGGGDQLLEVVASNVGRNHRLVGDRCTIRAHKWGELDLTLPPRLDYVLGADVTYTRQSLEPLCRSIRWMLRERRPRVVLAHEQRHPKGLIHLCECAMMQSLAVRIIWHDDVSSGSGVATQPDNADGWAIDEELVLSRGSIVMLEVADIESM